jgi:hypothetical protein
LGLFIGAAGAGKTTLLKPLVTAWRAEGREVFGAALAWTQTDALADAGISQRNRAALSVFLAAVGGQEINSPKLRRSNAEFAKAANAGEIRLGPKSVVVVDEIGLVGTKQFLDLARLQKKHGFQLVLLGDDRQCQSIEAGPVISILRDALGKEVPEVLTTLRQRAEREKEIVGKLREGKVDEAVAIKMEDETLRLVAGDPKTFAKAVAELWQERRQANRHDPSFTISVSVPTNAQARTISEAIRNARHQAGEIGADVYNIGAIDRDGTAYDLLLAVGDKVRLYGNTNATGGGAIGRNGSVLEVLAVNAQGVTLRAANGREGMVRWTTLQDRETGRIRLGLGYATTIDSFSG